MRKTTPPPVVHAKTRLRLLQTTDLHMQLIPYDYDTMQVAPDRSLVHLRDHIAALRDEGIPTVLCDTGDFLQGNTAADIAIADTGPHPMIAAFNDMGYDAIVLGNHDFDYGLDSLRNALTGIACPVLAANVDLDGHQKLTEPYVILRVTVDHDGMQGTLNVGLLGLTIPGISAVVGPDRTMQEVSNAPIDAAKACIPKMKAGGADLIVALCHFGIDPEDPDENIASRIAALDGIDAVMAGHTHDVFPGPDIAAHDDIDPVEGTVHGKPCVMAGAHGSHIGIIDLTLTKPGDTWTITTAKSRIVTPRPNRVPPPFPTPGLLALHEATVARLNTPVATTTVPLSTAFSCIQPDMTQQLLAESRIARIKEDLVGSPWADKPILGSAAPYRVGGKHAQDAYIDVPPGPVTLRDVIGIYPFQDPVVGLAQTGTQIRAWLERSAGFFNQIMIGQSDQPLINPAFPPYFFTTLYGLTYRIDPSQPVGARIKDLHYQNVPVDHGMSFVVATTPHLKRSNRDAYEADTLCVTTETSQNILVAHLRQLGTIDHRLDDVWNFAALTDTAATFVTHAAAQQQDTARALTALGARTSGQQQFRLHFT